MGITRLGCERIVVFNLPDKKFKVGNDLSTIECEQINLVNDPYQTCKIISDRLALEDKLIYINLTTKKEYLEVFLLYLCTLARYFDDKPRLPFIVNDGNIQMLPLIPLLQPDRVTTSFLTALVGVGGKIDSFSDFAQLVPETEAGVKGVAKTSYFARKMEKLGFLNTFKQGRRMGVEIKPAGKLAASIWGKNEK